MGEALESRRRGRYTDAVNRAAKLIASLLVTLGFSWWTFRATDWPKQMESLRSANYLWVLPYVGILLLIHLARTLRWGCLLSGLERVPFKPLNEASAIGFMMLLVMPFRLGEFARPFLIARRSGVHPSAAMTTVVLERITDGLFVAILMRSLLFFVPADAVGLDRVKFGANVLFALFGGGLVFLLFALWHQERAVSLVRSTVGRVVPGVADMVAGVVDTFVGAMRQLPNARQQALFMFYTLVYWGLNAVGMAMLSRAFGGVSLTLFQSLVVMSMLVVGLMIPAAPGMVGTFQWGMTVGMTLFLPADVVNGGGMAYSNVLWLCQTVQQVGLGMLFMSMGHLSFRDIAGKLGKEPEQTSTLPTA